jgi:hypothetical protein
MAQNGTKWHKMAQNGTTWHNMAQNGTKLPMHLMFVGPSLVNIISQNE